MAKQSLLDYLKDLLSVILFHKLNDRSEQCYVVYLLTSSHKYSY